VIVINVNGKMWTAAVGSSR